MTDENGDVLSALPMLQRRRSEPSGGVAHLLAHAGGTPTPAPTTPPTDESGEGAWQAASADAQATAAAKAAADELDWTLVQEIRAEVSRRLPTDGTDSDKRATARQLIEEQIELILARRLRDGLPGFSTAQRAAIATAVFDQLFGVGRLQPLLDNPRIRNIHITGNDRTWIQYEDGTFQDGPAVADTDAELLALMSSVSRNAGLAQRSWDASNVALDMSVSGHNARVAALTFPATTRPATVIRQHSGMIDVDLGDLVKTGMLTEPMAALLRAAQDVYTPMMICGDPGSGKTTLMRAIGNELPFEEPLVTLEEEYELFFDQLKHRHRWVLPIQMVPTRVDSDAGGFTLEQGLHTGLRANSRRMFWGESHGGAEAMTMFRTMQKGVGAIATTHALSAQDCIDGMIQMVIEQSQGGPEFAHRMIPRAVGIVVHVHNFTLEDGTSKRLVTEIVQVQRGHDGPTGLPLFTLDEQTMRHEAAYAPAGDLAKRMRRVGYDASHLPTAPGQS